MATMDVEEMKVLHDKLAELVEAGNEDEAREALREALPRLPEELKNEILGRLFFQSLVDEAAEIEAVAKLQKEGVEIMQAIEMLKKSIAEEEGEGSV